MTATLPATAPSEIEHSRARWPIAAWVLLGLIVAGGIALRWWRLGSQSLWWDEGYTAWIVSLPASQVNHVIAADVSPPFYYWLLRGWSMIFGESESALRGFSALTATLAIPLFVWLALRVLKKPAPVLVAVALFCLTLLQIQYAAEARFYSFMSLLGLAGMCALLLYRRHRSMLNASVLMSVLALSVHVNNMMWFYLAALDIAWLLLPDGRRIGPRLRDIALINAAVVALFIPWIPSFLTQLHRVHTSFWAAPPTAANLLDTTSVIAGGKGHYLAYLFYTFGPSSWVVRENLMRGLTVALLLAGVIVALAGRRREIVAIAVVCLLPVLVVFFYSLFRQPLFMERVFVPSSALAPILFAAPLALGRRWIGISLASLALILIGVTTFGAERWPQPKEPWRQVVTALLPAVEPRGPRMVLFVGNEGEMLFDYYVRQAGISKRDLIRGGVFRTGLPSDYYAPDPPVTTRGVTSAADLKMLEQTLAGRAFRYVDLVLSHTSCSDPQGLTKKYLDAHARPVGHDGYGEIDVWHYAVE